MVHVPFIEPTRIPRNFDGYLLKNITVFQKISDVKGVKPYYVVVGREKRSGVKSAKLLNV